MANPANAFASHSVTKTDDGCQVNIAIKLNRFEVTHLLYRALTRYNSGAYEQVVDSWEANPAEAWTSAVIELIAYGSKATTDEIKGALAKRIHEMSQEVIDKATSN